MVSERGESLERGRKPTAKRAIKSKPRLTLEKSAGAVVFHRRAEQVYLLIFSTYWEFPKGQVEPDESEAAGAVREVCEETGLAVKLLPGFRQEVNYFYRRSGDLIKKQVVYFLGEAPNQNVQVSWEHQEAKWLPFDAALAQLKYKSAREILIKANDLLKRHMTNDRGRM